MSDDDQPVDWWVTLLRPVDFKGIWALVMDDPFGKEPIEDPVRREQHCMALYEMHELIQEARFELGLATRLQYLHRTAIADGTATPNNQAAPAIFAELGLGAEELAIPPAVMLLLADEGAQVPRPAAVWDNLHQHMSHHRVLSLWLSAQMIDSSVVRMFAALDRLATALHFALGADDCPKLREDRGVPMLPTFDTREVDRLAFRFGETPQMKDLRVIARDELTSFGRGVRDVFVHRGRMRSAGHSATAWATLSGIQQPLHEYEHLALGTALFDRMLRPAVRAGAAVLIRRRTDLGFDPADLGPTAEDHTSGIVP